MSTLKTEKGTALPLIELKGKSYLQVAYRLQWLSEKYERYTISSEIVKHSDSEATVRTTVTIFDDKGGVLRSATATKTESKKDFNDFLEKAETSSAGRALSMLGLGTQHALADLDEGERIVDSPLPSVKSAVAPAAKAPLISAAPSSTIPTSAPKTEAPAPAPQATAAAPAKKPSSFKRPSSGTVNTNSKGVF